MYFNSYPFVLLFLPLSVVGYFLCNKLGRTAGKCFLLAASLFFYGCFDILALPILCGGILANYLLAAGMRRAAGRGKKALLLLGLAVDIGLLLFFKYTGFFLDNWNALTGAAVSMPSLIVPIGISFFTFQQIAFLVDSYRDETISYPILDYAMYSCFFPYVISGPIALHSEIIPQLQEESRARFDAESFSRGLCSFSFGLGKKVLLADQFGPVADWAFSNTAELTAPAALLGILAYTMQIYFDFSGYSDMARGIGQMLNMDIPINFDSPYRALSVTDFWRRWHITLTKFLTRYVYIPLGGNRKGTARTYLNVMLVFLLSGFWHGANWTFLLWGVLHGLGSVVCRAFRGKASLPKAVKWLLTFLFLNVTWVFFRADSVGMGMTVLQKLFTGGFSLPQEFIKTMELFPGVTLPGGNLTICGLWCLLLAFGLFASIFMKNSEERAKSSSYGWKMSLACIALLVLSVLSFSGVTSFIYVNF